MTKHSYQYESQRRDALETRQKEIRELADDLGISEELAQRKYDSAINLALQRRSQ